MNISFAIFGPYIANIYYPSEIYIWLDVLYFLWKLNQGKKLGLSISKNEGGALVLITKHWLFQAHTFIDLPPPRPGLAAPSAALAPSPFASDVTQMGALLLCVPPHGSDTGVCIACGGCHFTALPQGPRLSPKAAHTVLVQADGGGMDKLNLSPLSPAVPPRSLHFLHIGAFLFQLVSSC